MAPNLASWWAVRGIDSYLTYAARMAGLTLEDLRRFAERYLTDRPKVIGVMGPKDAVADIAETLRGAGGGHP